MFSLAELWMSYVFCFPALFFFYSSVWNSVLWLMIHSRPPSHYEQRARFCITIMDTRRRIWTPALLWEWKIEACARERRRGENNVIVRLQGAVKYTSTCAWSQERALHWATMAGASVRGRAERQSESGMRTDMEHTVNQKACCLQPNSGRQWHSVGFNLPEKHNGGGKVPKQGHLIYSETHVTFSTNWCEIFCGVTNSWLPLTHYLWFSLSSSSSSIFHLFPSSSSSCCRSHSGTGTHRLITD